MKLEGVIHCEGPECEHHQHVGVPNMDARRLPAGWIKVIEYGDADPYELAYCGWNCVLKAASKIPPPEIIPWTEALGGNPDEDVD